jgi:hypothetical protein
VKIDCNASAHILDRRRYVAVLKEAKEDGGITNCRRFRILRVVGWL